MTTVNLRAGRIAPEARPGRIAPEARLPGDALA